MKTVLFYQHFGKKNVVRGAHHKTFDFFQHIKGFADYKPVIYFDETSIWEPNIPWFHCFDKMPTLNERVDEPDILFLNSGKDWIKYKEHRSIPETMPIVSPVNNFRAVNPSHKSFEFLTRKAVRLCPSQELYQAVNEHPLTNGETIYLPNGVGITQEALAIKHQKTTDILIVGNKNPELARKIYAQIKGMNQRIDVIDGWISKELFQEKLASSKISIHCPKVVEEHYIPGVEAMMLDSLVIIPDCVGNRSYSIHEKTCVVTPYNLEGMLNALESVLNMDKTMHSTVIENALKASQVFQIQHEKEALFNILNSTAKMW